VIYAYNLKHGENPTVPTATEHFVIAICLSAQVSSGDTDEWIGMPFGVVSGVGLGMGILDFGGDRRRGMGSLVVNTMQKWRIDRLSTRV